MPFYFCRTLFTELVATEVGHPALSCRRNPGQVCCDRQLSSGQRAAQDPWLLSKGPRGCGHKPSLGPEIGAAGAVDLGPLAFPMALLILEHSRLVQRSKCMYLKHCLQCLHCNPVCSINYPATTVAMTLLKAIKANVSISDLRPTLPIHSWTPNQVPVPSVHGSGTGTDCPKCYLALCTAREKSRFGLLSLCLNYIPRID